MTIQLFSHFNDGLFTGSSTYRRPEYFIGEIQHIFGGGLVVVSLSPEQIINALCDGELLGHMGVTQEQVEDVYNSLTNERGAE